jgi:hypothetical protein
MADIVQQGSRHEGITGTFLKCQPARLQGVFELRDPLAEVSA